MKGSLEDDIRRDRLTAAAPDLLAACELLVEKQGGYPPSTADAPLNAARAAIAKAKGEG